MATWHQQQASTKLYHDTEWTVVTDPPNELRYITVCPNESSARELAKQENDERWIPKYGRPCARAQAPARLTRGTER